MQWKTQEMTRRLLDEMYQPTPEGICGNEDVGQMSAWYVLTALGLYDVAPGDGQFTLTTPIFEKAVIKVSPDTTLTILANNPVRNRYIEKVELNGKTIDSNFIDFAEIKKGGVLQFTLTDKPVKTRGTDITASAPYSMTSGKRVSTPFVREDIFMFADSIEVSMGCATPGAVIYYTLDGSEPTVNSERYTAPFYISGTCPVKAVATLDGFENSPIMDMTATEITYESASNVSSTKDGVRYTYYEGLCEKTADITAGTKIKEGVLAEPGIGEAQQEDHFAFIFEGYINVPSKGVYTFRTTTDDGSVLYIDNKLVVNNDGGHAAVSAQGSIGLEAGLHPFRLLYFEDYEGEEFGWDWKVPGTDAFAPIPVSVLKF
ncbi:MAG: glycoside hydrolase family 92 protein [Muribaculaceae bacterium]|nr:glycoside hydrolase family 92 protein [Muribaculaceae bacterium]